VAPRLSTGRFSRDFSRPALESSASPIALLRWFAEHGPLPAAEPPPPPPPIPYTLKPPPAVHVPQPTWTLGSMRHRERSYRSGAGGSLCHWDHLPAREPRSLSYMGPGGETVVSVTAGGQTHGAGRPAHSAIGELLAPRPRSRCFRAELYSSGKSSSDDQPHGSRIADLSQRMHESTTFSWRGHSWRGQDHASSSPHGCEALRPAHGFGVSFPPPVVPSHPYTLSRASA